jgi:hypothetical protein
MVHALQGGRGSCRFPAGGRPCCTPRRPAGAGRWVYPALVLVRPLDHGPWCAWTMQVRAVHWDHTARGGHAPVARREAAPAARTRAAPPAPPATPAACTCKMKIKIDITNLASTACTCARRHRICQCKGPLQAADPGGPDPPGRASAGSAAPVSSSTHSLYR